LEEIAAIVNEKIKQKIFSLLEFSKVLMYKNTAKFKLSKFIF